MSKPLGNAKAAPETLEILRQRTAEHPGMRWAAYQHRRPYDMSPEQRDNLGHLQFVAVGPECKFKVAPERLPDTNNWRYLFVGWVNLATGEIEP